PLTLPGTVRQLTSHQDVGAPRVPVQVIADCGHAVHHAGALQRPHEVQVVTDELQAIDSAGYESETALHGGVLQRLGFGRVLGRAGLDLAVGVEAAGSHFAFAGVPHPDG